MLREKGDLRRLHGKPSAELAAHTTKISQNTWAKGSDSGEMVETVKMPSTIQHFGMSDISAGQHKHSLLWNVARMASNSEKLSKARGKGRGSKGRQARNEGARWGARRREAQQNGNSKKSMATRVPVTFLHPPRT